MKTIREWWKEFCDRFLVWFIVICMILWLISIVWGVVGLIVHRNDKPQGDGEYDEYLEELNNK